jgi:REP element-mobilizing transposase RayT
MQYLTRLIAGNYYHIYNRGINNCNIFFEPSTYQHFLHLYIKYIEPVADTYAWVLMPNHFHFLVKIREHIIYKYRKNDASISSKFFEDHKWETVLIADNKEVRSVDNKIPKAELHFSHMFNSYSKYINTKFHRQGNLLVGTFQRKPIQNIRYLKSTLLYIHNNPVKHTFCDHPVEYPWSSYLTCISLSPTNLKRSEVMGWFNSSGDFVRSHENYLKTDDFFNLIDF